MAFGAVRKAYKAPARFFADDPEADNQIIWYNVPDDTEIYDDWTVFTPRVDTPPNEATSAYEREGIGRVVRTFYNGFDEYGFPGTHVHGDPEDFSGLAKRKKYFVGDVAPVPPCPSRLVRVPFSIGVVCPDEGDVLACACNSVGGPASFDMIIDAPDYPEIDGMVVEMIEDEEEVFCTYHGSAEVLAGSFVGVEIVCAPGGGDVQYLYTVLWPDSPYGEWELAGPLVLGDFTSSPWGFSHTDTVAIDFEDTENLATIHTAAFVSTLRVGFEIGLTVEDVPPPPEEFAVGFEIGLAVVDVEPPIEEFSVGLLIGVEVIHVDSTIEILPLAFLVGIEATDP